MRAGFVSRHAQAAFRVKMKIHAIAMVSQKTVSRQVADENSQFFPGETKEIS
jgi:hypothetical protein